MPAVSPAAPQIDLDTIVLAKGAHDPEDGEMCVMEVVSMLDENERFTDHPAPTVTELQASAHTLIERMIAVGKEA